MGNILEFIQYLVNLLVVVGRLKIKKSCFGGGWDLQSGWTSPLGSSKMTCKLNYPQNGRKCRTVARTSISHATAMLMWGGHPQKMDWTQFFKIIEQIEIKEKKIKNNVFF